MTLSAASVCFKGYYCRPWYFLNGFNGFPHISTYRTIIFTHFPTLCQAISLRILCGDLLKIKQMPNVVVVAQKVVIMWIAFLQITVAFSFHLRPRMKRLGNIFIYYK